MVRKDDIIKEIYTTRMMEELFKNMGIKDNDIDDLTQEIFVILLEYNEDKIIQMYEQKQLKWFIIKLIKNQYFSCNSPYYKKYKKYYTLVDGNIVNGECENEEQNNGCDE